MAKIVLGGGCFWGMEELFRSQPGVINTEVGYAGGKNDNPTYENHPGHAEVLQITYDESKTNVEKLFDFFFSIHDPTTKNQQGNDIGDSYRSVIFYINDTQKKAGRTAIIRNQLHWKKSIVTTIEPLTHFWVAEKYHQDYLQHHPNGYTCHYKRY